jgi:hypothetical protein
MLEQTHRDATPHTESTNDSYRTRARFHATIVPPSMTIFCVAESPNCFPWVIDTTFGEMIYTRGVASTHLNRRVYQDLKFIA